jgi:hypothetical protein
MCSTTAGLLCARRPDATGLRERAGIVPRPVQQGLHTAQPLCTCAAILRP